MTGEKAVIKIAQIVGNSVTGGVPSCILNYYRFFNKKDFQFDFFTYGPSRLDEEIRDLGGNVIYMPSITNLPKSIPFLSKTLRENNYDIAHSHLTSLSVFALFSAKRAGVKVRYCHAHSTTSYDEPLRNIVKNTLKKACPNYATRLLACSDYSAKWMYGKRSEKAIIIKNAVDTEKFSYNINTRNKMREAWKSKDIVVGHIGRFEFQKNHEFLIKAFEEVVKIKKQAQLVLVGQGSLETKIREQVKNSGLENSVVFLPEIKEVERYYNGFDILLLPSRYEGLPLVGVEAQSVGLPCIFSDSITKEIDITGDNLFLPAKNPDIWAESAIKLVNNHRQNKGYIVKEKGYDIRDTAKVLEELYRKDCSL